MKISKCHTRNLIISEMHNSEPTPFQASCPGQLNTWGQISLQIYHKLSNTLIQHCSRYY